MELDIAVVFYKNKVRKFVVVLNQKEVNDVFRLEQIISDLQEEIVHLQSQLNRAGILFVRELFGL
jgi:hypothetical protein